MERPVTHRPLYVILLAAALSAAAQDTRNLTEPKFPAACTVLKAQLAGGTKGLDPADDAHPDTARLQSAIDACDSGKAVELAADAGKVAFLAGPFHLKAGVTLLVDKGVTLYASRTPKDYELSPGSCGLNSEAKTGCTPWITGTGVTGAGIMGDGVIDARGGAHLLVDGKEGKTWWDLAAAAKTQGRQQVPRMIEIEKSDNFTMYRITLKNSPNFHVVYSGGDGFTVWGVKIDTPLSAKNTDGIDPGASKNITIAYSYIRDGDDNIAIKGGRGPVTNMTVAHNHFYYGHGMSIGSETKAGVSKVVISDLSLDGTDSGIRIKSDLAAGGLVNGVLYNDVCIRGSRMPIALDTNYTGGIAKEDKGLIPVYQNIVLRNVRVSGGGRINLNGFDATHRLGIQFDGVTLDSPTTYKFDIHFADIITGPGPVNFQMSGENSTLRKAPPNDIKTLDSCTAKFVPFPAD
jgi:polygalacturonase